MSKDRSSQGTTTDLHKQSIEVLWRRVIVSGKSRDHLERKCATAVGDVLGVRREDRTAGPRDSTDSCRRFKCASRVFPLAPALQRIPVARSQDIGGARVGA